MALLSAAILLEPSRQNEDSVRLAGYPIPPFCSMKRTFGLPCPGCGLTRSWVSAAHGKLAQSLDHHRLGWLLLLFAVTQTVRHGFWLASARTRTRTNRWGRKLDLGLIPLGVLLLLNWLMMLAQHYQVFGSS